MNKWSGAPPPPLHFPLSLIDILHWGEGGSGHPREWGGGDLDLGLNRTGLRACLGIGALEVMLLTLHFNIVASDTVVISMGLSERYRQLIVIALALRELLSLLGIRKLLSLLPLLL
jgi:hypothetical protein